MNRFFSALELRTQTFSSALRQRDQVGLSVHMQSFWQAGKELIPLLMNQESLLTEAGWRGEVVVVVGEIGRAHV